MQSKHLTNNKVEEGMGNGVKGVLWTSEIKQYIVVKKTTQKCGKKQMKST